MLYHLETEAGGRIFFSPWNLLAPYGEGRLQMQKEKRKKEKITDAKRILKMLKESTIFNGWGSDNLSLINDLFMNGFLSCGEMIRPKVRVKLHFIDQKKNLLTFI